ncbi:MAG: sodium/proline symporter [bacterium]
MDSTLLGFILYLILILVVGILTLRLTHTLADYLLAGRRLGVWVVTLSERASGESAWLLIGLPGIALAGGFSAFWTAIGCVCGILFSWTAIAKRLRVDSERFNALTIPDYFEARFANKSRLVRMIATAIIIFFFTAYVAAQFQAAGKVLNITFGLSPLIGMLIGAFIIVAYTMMGGFFAVAWTDLFQGFIMLFTLVLLPLAILIELGGLGAMHDGVAAVGSHLTSMTQDKSGWLAVSLIAGGLGVGLGYMGQPHLVTRFMAIRDPEQLKRGTVIAGVWAILAFTGAVLIGLTAIAKFGGNDLSASLGITDQEQIMPYMVKMFFPPWTAGILISGAIAAMMSTADSQLVICTSAISEDIYHQLVNRKASQKTLLTLSRLTTLAIGIVAFILAYQAEQLVYWMVLFAWAGLGSAFGPPLLLSLWWKKTTRAGAAAGMVVGTVVVIIWYFVPVLKNNLYEMIPGFFASLLTVVVVSLLTQPRLARTSV